MNKRMYTTICGALVAGLPAFFAGEACAALMEGKVMDARLNHQTSPSDPLIGVQTEDFVVGPEVELRGFGFREAPPLPALVDVDISDEQILITLLIDQPAATGEVLEFIDANNTIEDFKNVLINPATTWPGLTPIRVNNGGGNVVRVNLTGLSGLAGQQILLDVIPEPSGGALAAAAGAGLAAVGRRRKA